MASIPGQPRHVPGELLELYSAFSRIRKHDPARARKGFAKLVATLERMKLEDDALLARYERGELGETV